MRQKQWRRCRCRFQDSCLRHRLIIARLEKKTERKPTETTSPFASKQSAVIASLSLNYTLVFFPKTPLQYDPVDDYYDTIKDGLNIYRIHTVMPGLGRHSVCPRQPSGLFLGTFNATCNAVVFLLLISPLVTFNAHTP